MSGPGRGQWRRVIGVSGDHNRTVQLDSPFDPPPTLASTVQIGPFRGQLLLVGNYFALGYGGRSTQLYAACYDCVVAQNTYGSFFFSNWGRGPHGAGWQPNLNNIIADNSGRTGRKPGSSLIGRGGS